MDVFRQSQYTKEFKQDAVELSLSSDKTREQIANNLDVSVSTLTRWVREYREHGEKAFPGNGKPIEAELAKLQAENRQLKMERDILKKATAFFAKETHVLKH